ncbi:MAG: hypothetical protein AAGG81_03130 [Chlamydiota bacterium]
MLYLLVPLYCAVSAIIIIMMVILHCSYFSCGYILFKELLEQLVKSREIYEVLEQQIDKEIFESEVEEVIDDKLDDLVLVFKQQIPMASTFLVGSFVEKLKKSAKLEILKIVPDIREKFVNRMKVGHFDEQVVDKLVASITWSSFKPIVKHIVLVSAISGYLLGLIQVAWMYFFGYIV